MMEFLSFFYISFISRSRRSLCVSHFYLALTRVFASALLFQIRARTTCANLSEQNGDLALRDLFPPENTDIGSFP